MFLENSSPDAVILDIKPDSEMDGIDLARVNNDKHPVPFIFLTSYAGKEMPEHGKKVKPGGYIVKPFNKNTILASLEIAIYNFAQTTNQNLPKPAIEKINKHLISPVSDREFDVLKLIYNGKTNQQVADEFYVSVDIIKKHINSAYLKSDGDSRTSVIVRLRELMTK